MSIFLDTEGRSTLGIALCARCSRKFSLEDLYSDPNSPGLMVCIDDLDVLDPYRLPAREPDQINLDFVRPDLTLDGIGVPIDIFTQYLITQDEDPYITQGNDNLIAGP